MPVEGNFLSQKNDIVFPSLEKLCHFSFLNNVLCVMTDYFLIVTFFTLL